MMRNFFGGFWFFKGIWNIVCWCVATPLKIFLSLAVCASVVVALIFFFSGDSKTPQSFAEKTTLGWTDRFWKDKTEVRFVCKGNLSQSVIQPAQITTQNQYQWVTFEIEGAVLCKPPMAKYKLFSPAHFVYFEIEGKKYGLYPDTPTTLQVLPAQSIQFYVVDSKGLDNLLNFKFITSTVSGDKFYPEAVKIKVVYSDKPFNQAREARAVTDVASLLPEMTGLSGKTKDISDAAQVIVGFAQGQIEKCLKATDGLQDKVVQEAQEWIEENRDQLPQIDASEFVESFQVWEAKKFKEIPKTFSQTQDRMFHDPFYESLDNDYTGSQIKVHELVVKTALALWDDPVVQEALADQSNYFLILDDLRVENLLSDPEVRVLLSDSSRFQEVLNDPRMRPIINDPQVRAFYQAQLAD